jgi:transcriptional regulator GlxA family with amidase domain
LSSSRFGQRVWLASEMPTSVDVQRTATRQRRGVLLDDARLFIAGAHGDPDLDLTTVAHGIATSTRQLQRVFAELAHTTFRDELHAARMQHAAELLRTTWLPVVEIARLVGHRQPAQFSKAFRRYYGASPTEFRSHVRGRASATAAEVPRRSRRPDRTAPAGTATPTVEHHVGRTPGEGGEAQRPSPRA